MRNSSGEAIDPPTVVCLICDPDGGVMTYTYNVDPPLERLSTGSYRLVLKPEKIGFWTYHWEARDSVNPIQTSLQGADEKSFIMKWTPFV
jgi:hypothetical protein